MGWTSGLREPLEGLREAPAATMACCHALSARLQKRCVPQSSQATFAKGRRTASYTRQILDLRCPLRVSFAKHCISRCVLQATSAGHTLLPWFVPFRIGCEADGFPGFALRSSPGKLA